MRQFFVLLLLFVIATNLCAADEPQLKLQGILLKGEFFGPPNYGEKPSTDALENAYYLQLPASIAVQNPSLISSASSSGLAISIYFVQLAVPTSQVAEAAGLIGRRVEVKGSLSEAMTGHQRTESVMTVSSIQAAASWSWQPKSN